MNPKWLFKTKHSHAEIAAKNLLGLRQSKNFIPKKDLTTHRFAVKTAEWQKNSVCRAEVEIMVDEIWADQDSLSQSRVPNVAKKVPFRSSRKAIGPYCAATAS